MSIIDDAVLLKMAEAEILGEAKRAAVRHSIAGVSGWQPCSKLNKTFLANTLLHTMASNRIISRKKANKTCKGRKTERKFLKKNSGEKGANFVFKKPIENKEKCALNTFKNKVTKNINEAKNRKFKNHSEAKKLGSDNKVKKEKG